MQFCEAGSSKGKALKKLITGKATCLIPSHVGEGEKENWLSSQLPYQTGPLKLDGRPGKGGRAWERDNSYWHAWDRGFCSAIVISIQGEGKIDELSQGKHTSQSGSNASQPSSLRLFGWACLRHRALAGA